jgi:hypothetical protein
MMSAARRTKASRGRGFGSVDRSRFWPLSHAALPPRHRRRRLSTRYAQARNGERARQVRFVRVRRDQHFLSAKPHRDALSGIHRAGRIDAACNFGAEHGFKKPGRGVWIGSCVDGHDRIENRAPFISCPISPIRQVGGTASRTSIVDLRTSSPCLDGLAHQITDSWATARTSISKSRPCTGGRAKCQVKPPALAPRMTISLGRNGWMSKIV